MIHELDSTVIWHGRLMVVAWAVLLPFGVVIARYFKILPRQKWPEKLDNQFWWHGHLAFQYAGTIATAIALYLIVSGIPSFVRPFNLHKLLGWATIILLVLQVCIGLLRGSKGGPTEAKTAGTVRGDHFDMSLRRRAFERLHKYLGFIVLVVAQLTIVLGLKEANAPVWMTITIALWWIVFLGGVFFLHSRRLQMGSYEAIWGTDASGKPAKQYYRNHPWVN